MQFVSTDAYYSQMLNAIPAATKRIVLAAMLVVADPKTLPILRLLEAAKARGVEVHILLDVFTQTIAPHIFGMPVGQHARVLHETDQFLRKLQEMGVRISHVGTMGINRYAGRCHIKVTIIDDIVYSFGGVNFSSDSFDNVDYMLKSTDSAVADVLASICLQIVGNYYGVQDNEIKLDYQQSILLDGGTPGKSIIYERVCEMVERSTHIWIVSQMVPTGRLARLIKQKEYTAYFNRPRQARGLLALALFKDATLTHLDNRYVAQRFVHAKYILGEMPDGTRALISGSHNFNWRGVAYGTREIALYSTNERLWDELFNFTRITVSAS